MWLAIGIIAIVLLLGLAWLASLDGNFHVKRSRLIQAPLEQVFGAILDFKSWPEWSPWLMHEPDADIVYSDNYQQQGGNYSWEGKHVGAGRLSHSEIDPNRSISQQIEFTRPFKSINQVRWNFEAVGAGTRLSWEMAGKLPFFFRFMRKHMEPMIGRDYELGLALLNGYINAAAAHPQISFSGAENLQDFFYWSIPLIGNLRQLEAARKTDIALLESAAGGQTGLALTIYHRLDPLQLKYNAEISVPVDESTPHSNYTRRKFSGGRYFKMSLRGDHQFLPLGWYALLSHCRMHKFRLDKTRPALEIYHDDPASCADSNEIVTALYIAIH